MLMNIMYYGDNQTSGIQDGLQIGPIKITPEQVGFFVFQDFYNVTFEQKKFVDNLTTTGIGKNSRKKIFKYSNRV